VPRISLHPEAAAEAEVARSWYEAREEGLGSAFVEELDRALALIRERPEIWPIYLAGTRRFLIRRFPFAVIYRIHSSIIQVLAIGHLKRRPGYWKSRGSRRQ